MEEIKERKDGDEGIEHTEGRDILQIVDSIKDKAARSICVPDEQPCTIYKVPKVLRQLSKKSYEPQLLSIGPYHRDKVGLKPMEEKKFQYLLALLSRNRELKLEDLVKEIKKLEAEARKCYSESITLESREFVEMMVCDGCFLVEILQRIRTLKINDELWLTHFIYHDMLLLENQLPFFILQRIFSLVAPNEEVDLLKKLIVEYCFKFVYILPLNDGAAMKEPYHHVLDMFHHHCLPKQGPHMEHKGAATKESYHHVLDMFHHCLPKQDPAMEHKSSTNPNADPRSNARCSRLASSLAYIRIDRLLRQLIRKWRLKTCEDPRDIDGGRSHADPKSNAGWSRLASSLAFIRELIRKWRPTNPGGRQFSIPSAEELHEAGIEFQRKEAETAGSFLDVEFDEKGVLKIPFLFFSDNVQAIFQNLIAYEQCHPSARTFFTGYASFMDDLINTAEDVGMLCHAGIIENGLGSNDEVAQSFNELCREIFFDPGTIHLSREIIAVNDYCQKRWPTWRAKLIRNYFNSPWTILSVFAAVLLLLLTITQTVFSILPNV